MRDEGASGKKDDAWVTDNGQQSRKFEKSHVQSGLRTGKRKKPWRYTYAIIQKQSMKRMGIEGSTEFA